jgi:hypothetical protein
MRKDTENWVALAEYHERINTASIPTRYPEDLQLAIQEYPETVVRDYLAQTEKALKWLKEHLNS